MCECGVSYINSGPMIGNACEVNRLIVSMMRETRRNEKKQEETRRNEKKREKRDETRLRIAEHRHQAASKEGRLARRKASATQQVAFRGRGR